FLVVGREPSIVDAPPFIRSVAERSGIDDVGLATERGLEAQQIGVSMSSTDTAAQRAPVEDDLFRLAVPASAHDGVAAIGEVARRRLGGEAGRKTVKALASFGTQQPQYIGHQPAGRPGIVVTFQDGGRSREDSARISRQSRLEWQEPTTVGVPDL